MDASIGRFGFISATIARTCGIRLAPVERISSLMIGSLVCAAEM